MSTTIEQFRAMARYIAAHSDGSRYHLAACNFVAFLDELREDGALTEGEHDELRRAVRPDTATMAEFRLVGAVDT